MAMASNQSFICTLEVVFDLALFRVPTRPYIGFSLTRRPFSNVSTHIILHILSPPIYIFYEMYKVFVFNSLNWVVLFVNYR